ncbi:MAG TPA: hypothetical protein VGX68_06365 [Thermoanaerobaculia bacterium]|jgi:hypothetical protein|nr:hypothetical protein [Thermoanaerobaculia bacterium]
MNPAENWQTAAAEPAPSTPAAPAASVPAPIGQKNPGLAALLSFFPGMGNVYNGLYMRGVTFFLLILCLAGIADKGHDLFGFAVAFFWIFNVIDAYRQATLINYGYAQDLGLVDLPRHPRASQGGVAAGILLFVIGLVALLERYFDVRLDWVFDLWPFGLVLLGSWMIWASLRERRRVEAGE